MVGQFDKTGTALPPKKRYGNRWSHLVVSDDDDGRLLSRRVRGPAVFLALTACIFRAMGASFESKFTVWKSVETFQSGHLFAIWLIRVIRKKEEKHNR